MGDIAGFLEEVPPHVCVIVDEAYCEFNLLDDPDASIELLKRHPNLVLLRTFSKVHGLAGLRVGFAMCGSDELPRALNQVRQPFGVNALAQAAAVEALGHQDEVTRRVERAVAERLSMDDGLARSVSAWPPHRRTSAGCASASRPTRPRSSRACSSVACWCGRAPHWGPSSRPCASPTGSPRRTPASWTPSREVLAGAPPRGT